MSSDSNGYELNANWVENLARGELRFNSRIAKMRSKNYLGVV